MSNLRKITLLIDVMLEWRCAQLLYQGMRYNRDTCLESYDRLIYWQHVYCFFFHFPGFPWLPRQPSHILGLNFILVVSSSGNGWAHTYTRYGNYIRAKLSPTFIVLAPDKKWPLHSWPKLSLLYRSKKLLSNTNHVVDRTHSTSSRCSSNSNIESAWSFIRLVPLASCISCTGILCSPQAFS